MSSLSGEKLARMIDTARDKIDALDAEAAKNLDKGMAVEPDEHFKYQELQAEFHVMEVLSPEAAQIVYVALGEIGSHENGGWAKGTDTATKVIVTQLMGELLTMKLKDALGRKLHATG